MSIHVYILEFTGIRVSFSEPTTGEKVGLSKSYIAVLIYDEKKSFSLSKKDSSNLLINLDYLDFSYKYDILFQKTTFHSYLTTLKKESLNINPYLLSNTNGQNWNDTNDKCTRYGSMELQRRCDKIKFNFKLNYDYNISKC